MPPMPDDVAAEVATFYSKGEDMRPVAVRLLTSDGRMKIWTESASAYLREKVADLTWDYSSNPRWAFVLTRRTVSLGTAPSATLDAEFKRLVGDVVVAAGLVRSFAVPVEELSIS